MDAATGTAGREDFDKAQAERTPRKKKVPPVIRPLISETRKHLPTAEAAPHILRTQQTLRKWACTGTGPIKPIHIGGLLGWPVSDLLELNRVQVPT